MHGHNDIVQCIATQNNLLFTGSKDKSIICWDTNTGLCIRRFEGHRQPVKSITVDKNLLYSASSDKTVKQWNAITGECIKTFKGHEGSSL